MNKALVTAMLLGLAAADDADETAFAALRAKRAEKAPNSEDCEDAATATARAAKARAEGEKALLDTEKARLAAVFLREQAVHDAAKVTSDASLALTADARAFLDTAQADFTAATAMKTDNTAITVSEATGISTRLQARTDANQVVTDWVAAIGVLDGEIVNLNAALTQHNAEKVTLTAIWQTAVDTATAKTALKDGAELAIVKYTEQKDGCASNCKDAVQAGSVADLATVTLAQTAAEGLVTNYINGATSKTENALLVELKALYNDKIRKTAYKTSQEAACQAISGNTCTAGDGVNELNTALWTTSSFASYDAKKGEHDAALAELAVLQGKKVVEDYNKLVQTNLKAAQIQGITDQETLLGATDLVAGYKKDEKDALAAVVAPLGAKDTVIAQIAQNESEIAKAGERLTEMKKKHEASKVLASIASSAYDAGEMANAAAVALVAQADIDLTRLTPYLAQAKLAGDRSAAYHKFYNDFTSKAAAHVVLAGGNVEANAAAILACEAKIAQCDLDIAAAVTRCKRRQYSDALASLAQFNADKAQADKDAEEAKAAYDEKKKAAVAKNADCRKNAEGVRAECAEGECCGQANRYDRDGTRMTIEVCGKAEDSTYTYWPVMGAKTAKAPMTEQWRYYCISGAQSLAAGATAVAAALYMAY